MKIIKRILIAASVLWLAGAAAAENHSGNTGGTIRTGTEPQARKKISPEEEARVRELQDQRNELLQKIHRKRVELLKNDPKLHRMYIQLLKQTRALALELDSNREMRELNDALSEVEKKIKKLSDK